MRVALVTTPDLACETGSTVHALDLARALGELGHDVHVLCATAPAADDGRMSIHRLPLPLEHPVFVDREVSSDDLRRCIELLAGRLAAIHAERPVDVVHCHYATFTASAGLLAWWLAGTPLVVSTFGRDLNVGAATDPRYERMSRTNLHAAAHVVAATRALAGAAERRFGVPAARITVLPMGIDERLFEARGDPLERPRGPLVVTIASSFTPEKGVDTLLRALARASGPAARPELWVLGDDDEPARANARRLETLRDSLGLRDSVRFLGRLRHADVARRLAVADVVVDPRAVGNYSSSLVEAAAAGKPIVCSDVANAWGLVKDGDNGLTFRSGDAGELAECLRVVLAADGPRAALAQAAERRRGEVLARFGMRTVAAATADVYRSVVERVRAAA